MRMGSNNTDGNEAERRHMLFNVLLAHSFLVLRLVCTVMWVVDEVEHWEG